MTTQAAIEGWDRDTRSRQTGQYEHDTGSTTSGGLGAKRRGAAAAAQQGVSGNSDRRKR